MIWRCDKKCIKWFLRTIGAHYQIPSPVGFSFYLWQPQYEVAHGNNSKANFSLLFDTISLHLIILFHRSFSCYSLVLSSSENFQHKNVLVYKAKQKKMQS